MSDARPGPTTMIIFGATGDLTRRKLLPALYRLQSLNMLPECLNIVGLSTRGLNDAGFRAFASEAVEEFSAFRPVDPSTLKKLTDRVFFVSSDFENPEGYKKIKGKLSEIDTRCKTRCEKLFYLATQPSFFLKIINMLDSSGLTKWEEKEPPPKIIIEKPFGRDLTTARELNDLTYKYFNEEQIYRIDHYLGKETVQNILFFRFANGIYEPIWNRKYVDHVQITVAENIGIEGRGKYFEEAGILRDIVQNHILQLLALVAMEPPINMDSEFIRAKKIELFRSLRPIEPHEALKYTVRGQYGSGRTDGEPAPAYREEKDVSPRSATETYVALKVMVDNWRWSGVPFYIRTGKRLEKRLTEIAIAFKEVPICLFTTCLAPTLDTNVLVLKIQPDEGINFRLNVKRPGSADHMETVNMDFSYKESFNVELPEAYERLLLDAMVGDATLFPHREGIEETWAFITKILEGWKEGPRPDFPNYSPGGWGPKEADDFIKRDGRRWREP
jgi:glucose-6-phosphate 1-dehydrogenase